MKTRASTRSTLSAVVTLIAAPAVMDVEATTFNVRATGHASTPLPHGLNVGLSTASATGWLRFEEPSSVESRAESIEELVRSASRYTRDIAIIPIDPEHDRFVEDFIRENLRESGHTTPLKVKK